MKSFLIGSLLCMSGAMMAQETVNPHGLYKLQDVVHQDGKHLEAGFSQYKYCTDSITLMFGHSERLPFPKPFTFTISNPDGTPLHTTGELSKTENKGIQVFGDSIDQAFTQRWFNDRGIWNERLFPYGQNIDEVYRVVNDSTDLIQASIRLLQMQVGDTKNRLHGVWKVRGRQSNLNAHSQYWVDDSQEQYFIMGENEALYVFPNDQFPKAEMTVKYLPVTYTDETAFKFEYENVMVYWFDRNTISMTMTDNRGQVLVLISDRCGLPENVQKVFGTNEPRMKKGLTRYMNTGFANQYGEKPDSIRRAFETFDYAITINEQNNAVFPKLMQAGFKAEYDALKDSLMAKVLQGDINADQAVGSYMFWFYKNFDRHSWTNADSFWAVEGQVRIDYSKLMKKYDPQPVGCKVDDETYLLRLPNCGGQNPTMEWLEKKGEEFKQSGCKYLILDLRGNSGGNANYSLYFTFMMLDGKSENTPYVFLNGMENRKALRRFWLYPGTGAEPEELYVKALEAPEGSFLDVWDTLSEDHYTTQVKRGAIIMDHQTVSAGEAPIEYVHDYSKSPVKVYGRERSFGSNRSGEINTVTLPNSNLTITFPMDVEYNFEKTCKDRNPGLDYDVKIPLPYPEELTDNIDEWVKWVAKDMKKR